MVSKISYTRGWHDFLMCKDFLTTLNEKIAERIF